MEIFREIIYGTTDFQQKPLTNGSEIIDVKIDQTTTEICTTKLIRWNEAFSELLIPGEIPFGIGSPIVPTSVGTGEYQIFPKGFRAPFCWSTNIPFSNVKGSYQGKLSAYRQSISDYLNQDLLRPISLNADYSYEFVYNEQQLSKAIRASLEIGKWLDISGSYDFESKKERTKVIVRFVQPYFQIDADPISPEEYFETPPTEEEMKQYGVDEYGLLYVSKIVMGRQLFLMLESSDSREKIEKVLNAELNFWKVNGEFTNNEENAKIIQDSKLRIMVMGGDATRDAEVITNGLEGIKGFIDRGAEFDPKVNPGVPLSYQLKRLKDNTVFNTVIASEYPIRECEAIPQPPKTYNQTVHASPIEPHRMCPTKIGNGDRDFHGNGPKVSVDMRLYVKNNRELWVEVIWHLRETKTDWTEAKGDWDFKLWTAPSGHKIKKIKSVAQSSLTYTDTDHGWDYFNNISGFVKRVEVKGDEAGNDIG
ncbi:MAG: thiol-activated cytolysin family protein, partial [Cyanobacteria bacterium J06649_11]